MGQRALLDVLKVGGGAADAAHAEALQHLHGSRIFLYGLHNTHLFGDQHIFFILLCIKITVFTTFSIVAFPEFVNRIRTFLQGRANRPTLIDKQRRDGVK